MPFEWHDHHFINRIACLDFANTVVYRNRPERTEDRLTTLGDVRSWLAATHLADRQPLSLAAALDLREAIDRTFRALANTQRCEAAAWDNFMSCCAPLLRGHSYKLFAHGLSPATKAGGLFAIAQSALALAMSAQIARLRVCGGCGWLFIDRTRNGSKKWCISAMCGSRDKARRYYARKARSAPQ